MKYSEYKYLYLSDLYRITGDVKLYSFIYQLLLGESYKYIFWLRTCTYAKSVPWLKYTLYPIARLIRHRLTYKFGITMYTETSIGSGFNISHFGDIVVNGSAVIGKNCTLSNGVTIGQKNRGKYQGFPVIGDNVYIGPGAKIIGGIKIGNNVAIGGNCVLTHDVPDNSVVVGIPGKVISQEGSAGYVNNTDYDDLISCLLKDVKKSNASQR